VNVKKYQGLPIKYFRWWCDDILFFHLSNQYDFTVEYAIDIL